MAPAKTSVGADAGLGSPQEFARFLKEEQVKSSSGAQPMTQCPLHWPNGATWVPIRDLEILEILDDQDVRAG
jgi:hypothetical protein